VIQQVVRALELTNAAVLIRPAARDVCSRYFGTVRAAYIDSGKSAETHSSKKLTSCPIAIDTQHSIDGRQRLSSLVLSCHVTTRWRLRIIRLWHWRHAAFPAAPVSRQFTQSCTFALSTALIGFSDIIENLITTHSIW